MARRLFYIDQILGDHAELRDEEAHHLSRVLRVEVGQVYELSDQNSLYLGEVETVHKNLVSFLIKEKLPTPPALANVTLYASLFKFDHFEWMLEKVTELGVSTIQPVIAERSERGLDMAAPKRMERWRKILVESGQQSRRLRVPVIHVPVRLGESLKAATGLRLLLDEQKGLPSILTLLEPNSPETSLMLGTEGGWAEREREAILAAGWKACSLGHTVLRAETAAAAALAVVSAHSLSHSLSTI